MMTFRMKEEIKDGKREDGYEAEEKPDGPRLIALPVSDIKDEDWEGDTTPSLDLSPSGHEVNHTESM